MGSWFNTSMFTPDETREFVSLIDAALQNPEILRSTPRNVAPNDWLFLVPTETATRVASN